MLSEDDTFFKCVLSAQHEAAAAWVSEHYGTLASARSAGCFVYYFNFQVSSRGGWCWGDSRDEISLLAVLRGQGQAGTGCHPGRVAGTGDQHPVIFPLLNVILPLFIEN